MTTPRKTYFIVAIAIGVVIALGFFLIGKVNRTSQIATLYAFTYELCDFIEQHNKRMPKDWSEFEKWSNARTDLHYESIGSWKNALDLKWDVQIEENMKIPADYIIIKQDGLKNQQFWINDVIRRRFDGGYQSHSNSQ